MGQKSGHHLFIQLSFMDKEDTNTSMKVTMYIYLFCIEILLFC